MDLKNLTYNEHGGIDGELTLPSGETVPYTVELGSELEETLKASGEAISQYVAPEVIVLVEDIKREANRRILGFLPMHAQNNMMMASISLIHKGQANWTAEDTAVAAKNLAAEAYIKAVRAKSNEIETISPLPEDYADASRWPPPPAS